jgi:hypothetical protein
MTSVRDFRPASEDSIFLVCLEFVHPVSERSQLSLIVLERVADLTL